MRSIAGTHTSREEKDTDRLSLTDVASAGAVGIAYTDQPLLWNSSLALDATDRKMREDETALLTQPASPSPLGKIAPA